MVKAFLFGACWYVLRDC